MSDLRTWLGSALLSASVLLWLGAERAHACSALASTQLDIVANADVRGPFVFLARCPASDGCSGLLSLRVERTLASPAAPEAVAGTFTTKPVPGSRDQLAIFTPASPLDAAAAYTVLEASGRQLLTFTIYPPGAAAPLDRTSTIDGKRTDAAGRHYDCRVDPAESIGACSPITSFGWSEQGTVHTTVLVRVPQANGWLVRGAQGELYATQDWQTSFDLEMIMDPGVEQCASLESWNVLNDQHETRRVCKTGLPLSAAEQNVVLPTPDIGTCAEPPRVSAALEASWLLETWCRDWRAYCATPRLNSCGTVDARCKAQASSQEPDASAPLSAAPTGVEARGSAREQKNDADAGAAEDTEAEEMSADAENDDGGCALAGPNANGNGLWLLALLGCARRRRRL